MTSRKTYSELSKLKTFDERFEYCKCTAPIGAQTFGGSRYLNQVLYTSNPLWLEARDKVIERDGGYDLGVREDCRLINDPREGTVHHLNPITKEQVLNRDPCLFDLENLILVRSSTHRLIHYGNHAPESRDPIERKPNDTCPWRK